MLEAIIVAVITGGLSLIGVIITSRTQHDKTLTEIKSQNAVQTEAFKGDIRIIQNDIADLERKQDKHNSLIERMFVAEKAISVLEEKQSVANNRIKDLEDIEKSRRSE